MSETYQGDEAHGGVEYDDGYDYVDPAERAVELGEQITQYHQQQAAQRQVEIDQQKRQDDEGFERLLTEYPVLTQDHGVTERLADRIEELAQEAYQRGEVAHPAVLVEDPAFVRQVWEGPEFNGRAQSQVTGDDMFQRMHGEQAQSAAAFTKNLWGDK